MVSWFKPQNLLCFFLGSELFCGWVLAQTWGCVGADNLTELLSRRSGNYRVFSEVTEERYGLRAAVQIVLQRWHPNGAAKITSVECRIDARSSLQSACACARFVRNHSSEATVRYRNF
jgi:hypothetical protein